MLSFTPISAASASSAAHYYEGLARRDEYYTEGKEPPGQWYGRGAETMELTGEVKDGELLKGFQGLHPATGEQLAANAGEQHKPGYDFTFSAPKSVSAVFGAGNQETRDAIRSAHDHAVNRALNYIESNALHTRHGAGGEDRRAVSSGVAFAKFEHGTSRAGDPQLHTHALALNVGRDAEGNWRGIDFDSRHKMLAGAIYRAELAHHLKEQGYAIDRDGDSFRVVGIPDALEKEWSKRRDEIEKTLSEKGLSSAKAAAVATLDSRSTKDESLTRDELHARWQVHGKEHGFDQAQIDRMKDMGRDHEPEPMRPGHEIVAALAEKNSTFTDLQLQTAVMQEAQGHMRPDDAMELARAIQREHTISLGHLSHREAASADHLKSGERLTTADVIETEKRLMDSTESMMKDRGHAVDAGTLREVMATRTLNDEQLKALEHVTSSRSVAVVQGLAGTGKTYAMDAVREAYERKGYEVIGTSISQEATQGLQEGAGIEKAMNIAKMIHELNEGRLTLDDKTVVIIDEAGMASLKDMERITREADQAGAKVIAVGDTKQIQAVDGGAPMRAMMEKAGYVELSNVVRQRDAIETIDRDLPQLLRDGKAEEAFQRMADAGRLHIHETAQEARSAAAEKYLNYGRDNPDKTAIVMASTNAEVKDINRYIRDELKKEGRIAEAGIKVETHKGVKEFAVGDRVQFGAKFDFGRKGDKDKSVWNGATGTVERVTGSKTLHVKLDHSKKTVRVETDRFQKIDHGYASTLHKSQGKTVDSAIYCATSSFSNKEMGYVGGSRHKHEVHIVTTVAMVEKPVAENGREQKSELARGFEKSDAKDNAQDYKSLNQLALDAEKQRVGWKDPQPEKALPDRGRGVSPQPQRGQERQKPEKAQPYPERGHPVEREAAPERAAPAPERGQPERRAEPGRESPDRSREAEPQRQPYPERGHPVEREAAPERAAPAPERGQPAKETGRGKPEQERATNNKDRSEERDKALRKGVSKSHGGHER